jgi:hypothetical protein
MLFAPLEQFELILFYKLNLLNIHFSYSNFIIINLLLFITIIIIFLKSVSQNKNLHLYFIPNIWQNIFKFETIIIITQLLIVIIFNFILLNNSISIIFLYICNILIYKVIKLLSNSSILLYYYIINL